MAQLVNYLQQVRHHLHQFPELSDQEVATTAYLREQLAEHDITVLDLPLATGLVAEIRGDRPGPLVVVRGDIDALPIEEQTELAFRSQMPGVMHACGHDFHASAVLGAAILLQQQRFPLAGSVRILFQPAEETGQGAPAVLASGALDEASVIFGLHNDPGLPVGVVGCKAGALTAGVDRFAIRITGTGSHAARPHEGNDPIVIAGQLITALQTLIARNLPSGQNAACASYLAAWPSRLMRNSAWTGSRGRLRPATTHAGRLSRLNRPAPAGWKRVPLRPVR